MSYRTVTAPPGRVGRVRGICAAVTIALLATTAAACGAARAANPPCASPSTQSAATQTPSWLLAESLSQASLCGDAHPQGGAWTVGTRGLASKVLCGGDVTYPLTTRVYAVVLRGSFIDTKAFTPSNQVIKGTWMVLIFDARSHDCLDFGLGGARPGPLAKVGMVHRLF